MILSPDRRQFTVNGQIIRLTPLQDSVLRLLLAKQGKVIRREAIMDHLYNDIDREPATRILEVIICQLRKKLRAAAADVVIETEWGTGYVLHAKPTGNGAQT